ncbi:MAG: carbon-nitrogen hydrolase family protein [Saprospiraceae bacterium]
MKKLMLYFQCILIIQVFSFSTVFSKNLVQNPGFEAQGQSPQYWTITGPVSTMQPSTSVDGNYKYEGSASLKMESTNINCHGRAVQLVDVEGGVTYLFSAQFMTKNVSSIDKSVMIRIKWLKGNQNLGYHYIYEIESEANGWSQASNKIKALPLATSAEISLEFRWTTGVIWWDNISMENCPELSPRKTNVGTVYFRPPGPTVEKNIALMGDLLDQAGKAHCQIICLPEGWTTSNTGIGMQKNEVNTIDGSASRMLSQKAKQYGMYIVSGLYTWTGDTLHNIAALYDRQGIIQSIYKKVHLPDSEAESGAVPGNSLPVFNTDFGKIGILICWDYAFPEVSRALALKGAEILFCPIAGDVRGTDIYKIISRSRAVDNGVYFVNSIFDGHSMIINPAGDILQESGTQGTLLMATIDLNFSPSWDWIGNEGRGDWKGVWRKDRRPDIFEEIGKYATSSNSDQGVPNKNK